MKSNLLIAVLIFLFFYVNISAFAQDKTYLFGSVSSEEMAIESCSFDKDAEAIILFDIGKAWFEQMDGGFDLLYDRRCRIKILKESGIKYANIEIPYYLHGNIVERIFEMEGNSWNIKDGRLVETPLDKSNYFDVKQNQYWMNRKVAMPDVKPGTIIEYHYVMRSNYLMNFRDWKFQTGIPTLYSSFEARMVPFYEYMYLLQGNVQAVKRKEFIAPGLPRKIDYVEYNDMVYQFELKNIPAFRDVEFIASEEDYITKIDFQLSKYTMIGGGSIDVLTTWPKLINELLSDDSFGKYVKRAESQAEKIINLDSIASMDDADKITAVIETIKERYEWNGINTRYASGSIQDLIKKKSGTPGDLNLLAVGLLKAAGLDAFPVIMSTRENGKIKYDYPYSHFFNYVIIGVNLNGKMYLADATDPLLSSSKLPSKCINDNGLIVKKDAVIWLDLSENELSIVHTSFNTELNSDGLMSESTVTITSNGYEANRLKKRYGQDLKEILNDLRSRSYTLLESDIRCLNYKSYDKPYIINFSATLENDFAGEKIFVSPFMNQPITINPVKNVVRTIPVDFIYPYSNSFESLIKIPDGFKVTYLPEEINLDNENISITYKSVVSGKLITSSATYTFKKVIYPATFYNMLKLHHNTIIKKLNDKIVITRI